MNYLFTYKRFLNIEYGQTRTPSSIFNKLIFNLFFQPLTFHGSFLKWIHLKQETGLTKTWKIHF